ncbi:MAG: OHCU decarboxylase [Proteobacteria bacterium]|nr:OHCU decarboxylase [Pseudomonadota bacterium]
MKHLSRDSFLATFGGVYEHSAWIAEMIFDKKAHLKIEKPSDLAGPMAKIVETAPQELQMALLRAYPDLAGKLGNDSAEAQENFKDLNVRYREKFGFPFILAIRDRNRAEILGNLRKRFANDVGSEFREALNQVQQIANLRLQDLDIQ